MTTPRRLAVIGHVQHVVVGRVPKLPSPGDIVHFAEHRWFPGAGGGVAFFQLAKSPAEVHFFTALGNDDTGDTVLSSVQRPNAVIHAARRDQPHPRDVVLVTPEAERTIIVVDEPLHPRRADALPWDVCAACDGVFYTAQDPDVLHAARAARLLVVTARRADALRRSGVAADVVVGSALDPREASTLADYPVPPRALVMTEGARGGWVETHDGRRRFPPSPPPLPIVGSYGAGDTFAGALTWYLASGHDVVDACTRAAAHGAAVLASIVPLDVQLPLG